jgi:hypothetical protein
MSDTSNNRESEMTHSSKAQLTAVSEAKAGDPPVRQVMLSVPQEQALEWLMNGGSVGEAAQFAGVSRQTISRWLRTDPDFQEVYRVWQEETASTIAGRMLAASESAMDVVLHAIRVKRDVRASQFVIKTLMARAGKG